MTPVLEMKDVGVTFRSRRKPPVVATADVSFSMNRGERLALVGRSGAGKSTVAKVALGLVAPTTGTVSVDGQDLSTVSRRELRKLRRRVHMIFQNPYQSLHPGMTVERLVGESLAIERVPASARAELVNGALVEVGLPIELGRRYPDALSGGQRQRVALARALVAKPELVVADEPTSMLDASLRGVMIELLSRLQEANNTAILYITHDLAMARYVGDTIAVMDAGRIVEMGPGETIIGDPAHPATKALLAAVTRQTVDQQKGTP